MEQHQIPQDVTGYKFNLFGILNLKQFLELIIPLGLAWIIVQIFPIPWLAWPIAVILGLYGVLAAFVPIQSRPLNYWIKTFLGIMYAPTKFYWHKIARVPNFFRVNDASILATNQTQININQRNLLNQASQAINYQAYNSSLDEPLIDPLDNPRTGYINSLLDNYATIPVDEIKATAQNIRPSLSDEMTLRQREIQSFADLAKNTPT